MSSLYLYALLEPGAACEAGRGVAGEPVRVVDAAGLAVAVGELDGAVEPSVATLAAHDAVVRRLAAETHALLPLRFGQTVPDPEALAEVVGRALPRLRAALAQVEGCEQVTLRVFGARAAAGAPTADGEASDAAAGPGTRYLAALQARRAQASTPPAVVAPALARVARFVRAQRVERHDAGPLLASVYQLVRRAELDAYRACLAAALEDVRDARVRVGDPCPPYAFADAFAADAPAGVRAT